MREAELYPPIINYLTIIGYRAERFESEGSRNRRVNMPVGWPDIIFYGKGLLGLVEVKLPSSLASGLSLEQLDRLLDGIERDAFAVCIDGIELLKDYLQDYLKLKPLLRKHYLLEVLPKSYTLKDKAGKKETRLIRQYEGYRILKAKLNQVSSTARDA